MANPKWGLKRLCQGCGVHFYDLNRTPIVCPKCSEVFDPELILKIKKSKSSFESPDLSKKSQSVFEGDFGGDLEENGSGHEDGLIEDPADLDVENDMDEVIERVTLEDQ